jgi:hypothetical protein
MVFIILIAVIIFIAVIGNTSSTKQEAPAISSTPKRSKPIFSRWYPIKDYKWLIKQYDKLMAERADTVWAVKTAEQNLVESNKKHLARAEQRRIKDAKRLRFEEAERKSAEEEKRKYNESLAKKREENIQRLISELDHIECRIESYKEGIVDKKDIDSLNESRQLTLREISEAISPSKNFPKNGDRFSIGVRNGKFFMRKIKS